MAVKIDGVEPHSRAEKAESEGGTYCLLSTAMKLLTFLTTVF